MPSGRSPRIWVIASRTSFTARSIGVPIPFYGELGSLNPVFVTPAAVELLIKPRSRGEAA